MWRPGLIGLCLLLPLCTGCGPAKADDVIKEAVACLNEAAEQLESITDENSAETAKPRLEKLANRWKSIRTKLDALRLSESDRKRLEDEYAEPTKKAINRLADAERKLSDNARKVLSDLPRRFES